MPSLRTSRLLGMLMVLVMVLGLSAIHETIPVHAASIPRLLISPTTLPLASPGSLVTFSVNVSNISPTNPLTGWNIYVRTNNNVLKPTGFVLGTFLAAGFESSHCVNNVGTGCDPNDSVPGTVHSAFDTFDTNGASGNGTLFTITYQAIAGPYTLVQFLRPLSSTQLFHNGDLISFKSDVGRYGNVPPLPVANFTFAPQLPFARDNVTFNASSSSDPNGYSLVDYSWTIDQIGANVPPTEAKGKIISNSFAAGNWTVTLTVTNSQGVSSIPTTSDVYVVSRPAHDLAVCTATVLAATCIPTISASQVDNILPGAVITIKVDVLNLGTNIEKNFNLSVTVADKVFRPPPGSAAFLQPRQQGRFSFQWDTTGLAPNSYTIHARVDPVVNETNIANNDGYYTVRLIYPFRGAILPFDMAQFGGLAVLSLFVVGSVVFLVRRGRNRRLRAQHELL